MKKSLLSLLLFSANVCVYASEMTLEGIGSVGQKPDYLEISVNINGECFESQDAVLQTVNSASQKIQNIFQDFADLNSDEVIAVPGQTKRQTTTVFKNGAYTTVCHERWNSGNIVTLRTSNFKNWSEIQKQILGVSDLYNGAVTEPGNPITRITLNDPKQSLYPETYHELQTKAFQEAVKDAKNKFAAVANDSDFTHAEIVNILQKPKYFSEGSKKSRARLKQYSDKFTPNFDLMYAMVAVDVTWKFFDNGQKH
jgi:uncharacterized protein YggE